MTGSYEYEWPVPDVADVLQALMGATGDMERGLPPKIEEMLVIFAAMHARGEELRPPPPGRARREYRRGGTQKATGQ